LGALGWPSTGHNRERAVLAPLCWGPEQWLSTTPTTFTTAYRGRDALLKVSTTGGSTFTLVGGCRTTNVTYNNNPVDISNALSQGYVEFMPDAGNKELQVALDGVITNDAMQIVLETSARDRTLLVYQINYSGAGVFQAFFAISTFTINGVYNQAQTFTAALVSSGQIVYTPG
jgi:predicted secreted protein